MRVNTFASACVENLTKEAKNDAGIADHPLVRWGMNCIYFWLVPPGGGANTIIAVGDVMFTRRNASSWHSSRGVEVIMSNRIVLRLIFARRVALASGAFMVLAAPVVSDMIRAHVVLAQSRQSALAQPAPSARPNFEVASIKPCKQGSLVSGPGRKSGRGGEGKASSSPGRLSFGCQTVENLIQEAYLRFMSGNAWPADPITGIEVPSISNRILYQSIRGGSRPTATRSRRKRRGLRARR
jgi:hypothetical protein